MATILFLCSLLQIIVFNFYWDFPNNTKIPIVILTILFLIAMMFNPTKMFYWVPRFEILKVMWEILIAPFGLVKFRHFFMADVITSAKLMLSDSCSMICFYSSGNFTSVQPVTCSWQEKANYAWAILPYWWRFWQCIHRYYGDRSNTNQLLNAGKYFCSILSGILAMMYHLEGGEYENNTHDKFSPWYVAFIVV